MLAISLMRVRPVSTSKWMAATRFSPFRSISVSMTYALDMVADLNTMSGSARCFGRSRSVSSGTSCFASTFVKLRLAISIGKGFAPRRRKTSGVVPTVSPLILFPRPTAKSSSCRSQASVSFFTCSQAARPVVSRSSLTDAKAAFSPVRPPFPTGTPSIT